MWIIIIVIVVVIAGCAAAYIFDPRILVTVTPKGGDNYLLEFENGQTPVCKLIHKTIHKKKEYFIFVPLESLSCIPEEDVLTLRCIKDRGNMKKCVLDIDYELYLKVKKTLGNRYTFKEEAEEP